MSLDKISKNLARKLFSMKMEKEDTKEFFYKIPRDCFSNLFEVYKIYENKFDELLEKNIYGKQAKKELNNFYTEITIKQIEAQAYSSQADFL